jgi:hypothetical protein
MYRSAQSIIGKCIECIYQSDSKLARTGYRSHFIIFLFFSSDSARAGAFPVRS